MKSLFKKMEDLFKKEDDNFVEVLIEGCVSAVWVNKSMSLKEKEFIDNLIENSKVSKEKKDELKRLKDSPLSLSLLANKINNLPEQKKRLLFETIIETLVADGILEKIDINFLKELSSLCHYSIWERRKFIKSLKKKYRLRIKQGFFSRLKIFLIITFIGILLLGVSVWFRKPKVTEHQVPTKGEKLIQIKFLEEESFPDKKLNANELYDLVSDGVVTVCLLYKKEEMWQGSGVFVGKDDEDYLYVLTNRHVVELEPHYIGELELEFGEFNQSNIKYEIELKSEAKFEAKLDSVCKNEDLAFLKVKIPSTYIKILPLRSLKKVKVGDKVYALGSPAPGDEALKTTLTDGIISAIREGEKIQTSAPISGGSSGGPLFNEYGEIIGINTEGYTDTFNFAISSNKVQKWLKEREIEIKKEEIKGESKIKNNNEPE